ncbi:hypothetical protein K8P10_000774 [Leucobacter sp. Psy1]|nr:hypothetical protein K8P10_000774 [Leucobacter sp. Psy1]
MLGEHLTDRRLNRCGVGDVEAELAGDGAARGFHLDAGFSECRGVAAVQQQAGARLPKRRRERSAQPSRRAGDEGQTALEIEEAAHTPTAEAMP